MRRLVTRVREPRPIPPESASPRGREFATRLAWLIACVALGLTIGFFGERWTGDEAWYLALPAAMVLGWLRFGRPDRCAPCAAREDLENHSNRR